MRLALDKRVRVARPDEEERWNRLVRERHDAALGEDRCRARKGALPRIMAAFANLAITLLRMPAKKNIRRAMRNFRYRPDEAPRAIRP